MPNFGGIAYKAKPKARTGGASPYDSTTVQKPPKHTYEMAFKVLNPEEEAEFRQWARDKFTPGEEIKEIWHPIVRDECAKMAKEAT